jgi:hypothetical protein
MGASTFGPSSRNGISVNAFPDRFGECHFRAARDQLGTLCNVTTIQDRKTFCTRGLGSNNRSKIGAARWYEMAMVWLEEHSSAEVDDRLSARNRFLAARDSAKSASSAAVPSRFRVGRHQRPGPDKPSLACNQRRFRQALDELRSEEGAWLDLPQTNLSRQEAGKPR